MTTIRYTEKINATKADIKTLSCDEYKNLCENIGCYEVIPDDENVKLYFDIDFKKCDALPNYDINEIDGFLDMAIECITDFCNDTIKQQNPRFTICQSNSPSFIDWKTKKEMWKMSYHIIVENVM